MSLQNGMWHDLQNGIITRNTIYAERLKVMKELKITNILKSSGWGLEKSELPWQQKFL